MTSPANDVRVHAKALVETDDIGGGTRVWAFAHVMPEVRLGADCNVGDHTFIESGVRIGDRVTIKNGVAIWTGVSIHDDVFVGPNAVFTNDLRRRSKVYDNDVVPTTVRRGASIGANATVVCGVTIGEFAMIGAGAVVTRDVPAYALIVGNPGRFRGHVCRCSRTLSFENSRARCECGLQFAIDGTAVSLI